MTDAPQTRQPRRNCLIGCVAALVVLAVVGVWAGPVVRDFARAGFLSRTNDRRQYSGTSMENLKALHAAMMLYHESEGQFPDAAGWMDAIEDRLVTATLPREEAVKKLVNPVLPEAEGVYGYAMNSAASGKFVDDIEDPADTPLIFDSRSTGRNAHGRPEDLLPDPPRPGGNLGISVDGRVLRLGGS
ncbi:MAG: hypothetical protein SNJ61_11045 [Fimbriimonadaceae bacterium]